ncbi:MAG: chemotaxis protein CheB, partial [Betaproteobacteria bacterium]|nr:chemotaxis protein CheB [Betaproteobacteria bacterium]
MSTLRRVMARGFISACGALIFSTCIPIANADIVMDWNATAAALPISAPPVLARVMAAMHGAVHDAVNAIEPHYESYRFRIKAPADASKEAAAASAAHGVLVALVPAHKASFDAALARSMAQIPDGRAKSDGIAVGKAVAEVMIVWRAKDNFDAKGQDQPGTEAGIWRRTPPGLLPGALPHLGGITPFLLKTVDQFAAKGRPALTSREFARDLDEIKRRGGRRSTERTAEQTAV